jgi:hypothetical protein
MHVRPNLLRHRTKPLACRQQMQMGEEGYFLGMD